MAKEPKKSSDSRWVRFLNRHDHTWPSRAMSHYPAGLETRVPTAVAEAAIDAGNAEEIDAPVVDETGLDNDDKAK